MKFPIGIQQFEENRLGDWIYVDKTAHIYNLAAGGKYFFLSRPRRFGKSMLLSTLEAYFHGKKHLFKGLAIEQLETEYMLVEDLNFVNIEELKSVPNLSVRIRYRSRSIPCQTALLDDGRLLVRFLEKASAITPGQSAVFYDGNRVLGGGFIASQQAIRKIAEENQDKFSI